MTSWHNALRQVGMVLKAKNLLGDFPLSDEKKWNNIPPNIKIWNIFSKV